MGKDTLSTRYEGGSGLPVGLRCGSFFLLVGIGVAIWGGGGKGPWPPPKAINRGAILSYGPPPQSKTDEKNIVRPKYPF